MTGIPAQKITAFEDVEFIWRDDDEFSLVPGMIDFTIRRDLGDEYPDQRAVTLTDMQATDLYVWLGRVIARRAALAVR